MMTFTDYLAIAYTIAAGGNGNSTTLPTTITMVGMNSTMTDADVPVALAAVAGVFFTAWAGRELYWFIRSRR